MSSEQGPVPEGPVLPGEGKTDYERYLKVDALLALQKPLDKLGHHDELLFQTVHQTSELWFRQILFELRTAGTLMDRDKPLQAAGLVVRSTEAVKVLTAQLHLLETMNPWDFHAIRRQLGRGSGAESPGFQHIVNGAPPLYTNFAALLDRRKVTLEALYTDPEKAYDVFRLAECMTDFDMFFHVWRLNHLAMVKRILGRDVKSLKGYTVRQLETDVQQVLWPALWHVRNKLTELAGTSPE